MKKLVCPLFTLVLMSGAHVQANSVPLPSPPSTVNAPWVETFSQNSMTLAYVGAVHHSQINYPNASTDPIFKTVAYEFAQLNPQAVVVEGVSPSDLRGFLNFAKKCASAGYDISGQFCDEPEFTAVEALNSGAAIFTGEPRGPDVLQYFEGNNYSIQDVIAFEVMINIPVEKAHTALSASNFSTFLNAVVASSERNFGINVPFTVADFQEWYLQNMPSPANYLDIDTNDTGPIPVTSGQPTKLNQMSATDSVMRDGNVVKTIQKISSQYQRILIVYGASHLGAEWDQLLQMFGTPIFSKPF